MDNRCNKLFIDELRMISSDKLFKMSDTDLTAQIIMFVGTYLNNKKNTSSSSSKVNF